jgi:tRNA(Ile)-lysidine synthase
MALATLYANAIDKDRTLPTCHAFIIDHKVRSESTEEAEWVKEQLRWKRPYTSLFSPQA